MSPVLLALLSGAAVGFCLGALGGGGGILVWPALVFGIGTTAIEASLLAKIIVGVCAAFAATLHWRKGSINVRVGCLMSAVGMIGAWCGARFISVTGMDATLAERAMLALLAGLMVLVSVLMFRKGMRQRRTEGEATGPDTVTEGIRSEKPVISMSVPTSRWILFFPASFAIGFITGFLGVGGGFMIVPTLVFVFGMPMKQAAGTSLVVIALNCCAGVASAYSSDVRWDIAALFAISSITASAIAVRVADRAKQSTLQIAFSGLVILLGALMVWKMTVT